MKVSKFVNEIYTMLDRYEEKKGSKKRTQYR